MATERQIYELFNGSNSLTAKQSMEARKAFNNFAYKPYSSEGTNDNYAHNTIQFFNNNRIRPVDGIVNEYGIIMHPRKDKIVASFNDNDTAFQSFDFVVRSFRNFAKAYSDSSFQGSISNVDQYLAKLSVYKGYVDPDIILENHISSIVTYVAEKFKNDPIEKTRMVRDFATFIPYATEVLKEVSNLTPINYSTLYLSNFSDLHSNGMMLDISNLAPSVDWAKVSKIIQNKNFIYFKQMAYNFGFNVVKEMPSKLIVDLDSEFIFGEVCVCGTVYSNGLELKTKKEIMQQYFEPAYNYDLGYLFNLFHYMYDEIVKRSGVISDSFVGMNSVLYKEYYKIPSTSIEEKYYFLNGSILLKIYIDIKNSEIGINFNESTLNIILRNARQIETIYGLQHSMDYINKKFAIIDRYGYNPVGITNSSVASDNERLIEQIRLSRYDYKI
jgi:hypothetical protein